MNNKIGIDAGGSLMKIAYEENGRIHFRKYPLDEMDPALKWIRMLHSDKTICLTGGRAGNLKSAFFPDAAIVEEFKAVCEGVKYLLAKEQRSLEEKFLLVNIGTGTSWFTMDGERYERVFGSGIGGGTLLGLGHILSGTDEFSKLVDLSAAGDRGNVDMLVKDIYESHEPPIPGDLTASNFAKASGEQSGSPEDQITSLFNMIAETITLFTVQNAAIHRAKKVAFIGSTLSGNKPLQDSLDYYCKMSDLEPEFIQNGEFSGAIGATL
ncbi:type II pantothenate kinase [Mesobacillus subterraneus]|uniref:Type II pantothenate kinase n=1 Tax=Mesobacillus subterraneus TaxID=285983 RepID=A0A427TMG3_9BACI|nr:type II pantothenate kinase [Mesobacillus subterraneus]RSD25549.1 type II pantothenate kinase [Mesobacillus subterraneus]